jgi:ABC-type nitrate/sulfonate/bicarbonate transport system substrate-binding protein
MLEVIVFEGVQNLPLFAAQSQGFFAQCGVEPKIQFTPNSWVLRDGLADGRYHIAHTAVDNAIAMIETAGKDVAIVMGGDNGFNNLFAQPGIDEVEDLRGKTVLVDAPNTAFALVLYQILAKRGLKRGDYTVKSIGATPFRLAELLKDRSAAASILNLPFRILAERAGLKDMGEAVSLVGPYLSTAGFVMRGWGQANADLLSRYIQSYVAGLRWASAPANRAGAIDLLAKNLRIELDVATRAYEIATAPSTGFSIDAHLDVAGLKNVLQIRADTEGQWGGTPPDPAKYLDLTHHARALARL